MPLIDLSRLVSLRRLRSVLPIIAFAIASLPASSRATPVILAGDFSNPFIGLQWIDRGYALAQKFTVPTGDWNITSAQLYLGMRYPTDYPLIPVVQIRDTAAGGGPGQSVLGSFSVNPNDIPPWMFGYNNMGVVPATPTGNISLSGGTYWLSLANPYTDPSISFIVGMASSPLTQTGLGQIFDVNGIAPSSNYGQTYGMPDPSYNGYAFLMQLGGQLVPEPSAGLMLGLGTFLCLAFRRRRVP